MTVDVDVLVAQLDARGEQWVLYRGGVTSEDGVHVWIVQLGGHGTYDRSVRADTLSGALEAAMSCPELQWVPREPPTPESWQVVKDGPKWRVYAGTSSVALYATKREATALKERQEAAERERWVEWHAQWGDYVSSHGEGVDFRWEQ